MNLLCCASCTCVLCSYCHQCVQVLKTKIGNFVYILHKCRSDSVRHTKDICTEEHVTSCTALHFTSQLGCMIKLYVAASVLTITMVNFWLAKQSREASRQESAGRSATAAGLLLLLAQLIMFKHAPEHCLGRKQDTPCFWPIQKIWYLRMRFHTASLFSLNTACTQGKAHSARFSKTIWQNHSPCRPVAAAGAAVLLHGEHSRAACHGNHCCHLSGAGW